LITVRIQMGIDDPVRIIKTVPQYLGVGDLKQIIRSDQDIASSHGVVLI